MKFHGKFLVGFTLAEIAVSFIIIAIVSAATVKITTSRIEYAQKQVARATLNNLKTGVGNLIADGFVDPNTGNVLKQINTLGHTASNTGFCDRLAAMYNTVGTVNCSAPLITNPLDKNQFNSTTLNFQTANGAMYYNLGADATAKGYYNIYVDIDGSRGSSTLNTTRPDMTQSLSSEKLNGDIIQFKITPDGSVVSRCTPCSDCGTYYATCNNNMPTCTVNDNYTTQVCSTYTNPSYICGSASGTTTTLNTTDYKFYEKDNTTGATCNSYLCTPCNNCGTHNATCNANMTTCAVVDNHTGQTCSTYTNTNYVCGSASGSTPILNVSDHKYYYKDNTTGATCASPAAYACTPCTTASNTSCGGTSNATCNTNMPNCNVVDNWTGQTCSTYTNTNYACGTANGTTTTLNTADYKFYVKDNTTGAPCSSYTCTSCSNCGTHNDVCNNNMPTCNVVDNHTGATCSTYTNTAYICGTSASGTTTTLNTSDYKYYVVDKVTGATCSSYACTSCSNCGTHNDVCNTNMPNCNVVDNHTGQICSSYTNTNYICGSASGTTNAVEGSNYVGRDKTTNAICSTCSICGTCGTYNGTCNTNMTTCYKYDNKTNQQCSSYTNTNYICGSASGSTPTLNVSDHKYYYKDNTTGATCASPTAYACTPCTTASNTSCGGTSNATCNTNMPNCNVVDNWTGQTCSTYTNTNYICGSASGTNTSTTYCPTNTTTCQPYDNATGARCSAITNPNYVCGTSASGMNTSTTYCPTNTVNCQPYDNATGARCSSRANPNYICGTSASGQNISTTYCPTNTTTCQPYDNATGARCSAITNPNYVCGTSASGMNTSTTYCPTNTVNCQPYDNATGARCSSRANPNYICGTSASGQNTSTTYCPTNTTTCQPYDNATGARCSAITNPNYVCGTSASGMNTSTTYCPTNQVNCQPYDNATGARCSSRANPNYICGTSASGQNTSTTYCPTNVTTCQPYDNATGARCSAICNGNYTCGTSGSGTYTTFDSWYYNTRDASYDCSHRGWVCSSRLCTACSDCGTYNASCPSNATICSVNDSRTGQQCSTYCNGSYACGTSGSGTYTTFDSYYYNTRDASYDCSHRGWVCSSRLCTACSDCGTWDSCTSSMPTCYRYDNRTGQQCTSWANTGYVCGSASGTNTTLNTSNWYYYVTDKTTGATCSTFACTPCNNCGTYNASCTTSMATCTVNDSHTGQVCSSYTNPNYVSVCVNTYTRTTSSNCMYDWVDYCNYCNFQVDTIDVGTGQVCSSYTYYGRE